MTEKKRLFISHSTKDDDRINPIADALEAAGFTVWVDHRNGIEPGTPSWDRAIRHAIAEADAGLFVMSEASLASEICGSECLLVRELGDPLYVLKLEDVDPINVWLYIKQIQYADLAKDFDAGMDMLIRTLKGEKVANAPQAFISPFTGEATLRQYLPYLFINPMRGREDDRQRLTESLNGVVQVTGTGGLGKSRLVAEVALKHPQGAVWYRCSELSTPADVLALLIEHLRLDKDSTQPQVLDRLKARPKTLMVIDNAEDVPSAQHHAFIALIARLQSAGAHVVLTSRVRWEGLKPMKEITPTALDLPTATQIAQDFAASQDTPLTPDEAEALAESARRYPRLIEWAVGQLGNLPLARVMAQLNDLKGKRVQEALDEMIQRSLRQMTAQEDDDAPEALLKCLTVFAGRVDYEAISALKPETLTADDLDDALGVLQKWRFVRYDRGEARYSVDEMVRLALPAPEPALHARHFAHYVALHGDYGANQAYAEDGTLRQHARITQDWDNIQTALAWGWTQEAQKSVDWVWALNYFMMLRRTNAERQALLEKALEVAQANDYRLGLANTLQAMGDLHRMKNDYEQARASYERALTLYEDINARLGLANTLQAMGDLHRMKNDYEQARASYERALTLYEDINDRLGLANTLQAMGDLSLRLADYEQARASYDRAVTLFEDINDRLGLANTLQAMGELHRMKNDYEQARASYERALTLYEDINARLGLANTLKAMGDLFYMQDDYEQARASYERALTLYEDINNRRGLANTLKAMGDLFYVKNDYEQARASYDRALTLYEDINNRLGLANTLKAMGDLHRMKNDYEQARASYERALTLYEDINERRGLANTLEAMGELHRMKNDYEQARASYDRAVKLFEDINERLGLANTLKAMGDLFYMQDDYEQARASYERALTLYEDINDRLGLANTLRAMGDLFYMQDDYGTAVERYQKALALGQAIGDFASQLNSLKGLAFTYHAQSDLPNACRYAQALLTLADSHPFFQSHPVVDGLRKTFEGWGCG